jgi:hypothetical protein
VDLYVYGVVEKWIFSGAVEATITPSYPCGEDLLVAFIANSFESELRVQYQF